MSCETVNVTNYPPILNSVTSMSGLIEEPLMFQIIDQLAHEKLISEKLQTEAKDPLSRLYVKALTTSDKQITDEKSKLFSQLKREWDAEIAALREVDTLQMFAHLNRVETEIDSWGETEEAHQKRCTIREARRLLQVMDYIGNNELT